MRPRTWSTLAAVDAIAPSTASAITASRVRSQSTPLELGDAPGVRLHEVRGRFAAARERFHRFLMQDGERAHLDLVGAVVLDEIELLARPRQVDVDHRAHPRGDVRHDEPAVAEEDRLVEAGGDEEVGAA